MKRKNLGSHGYTLALIHNGNYLGPNLYDIISPNHEIVAASLPWRAALRAARKHARRTAPTKRVVGPRSTKFRDPGSSVLS